MSQERDKEFTEREEILVAAHKHSFKNRSELERSEECGCFYCLSIFPPSEIELWADEGKTAVCSRCDVDSVLGSASGYPITKEFLFNMRRRWFEMGSTAGSGKEADMSEESEKRVRTFGEMTLEELENYYSHPDDRPGVQELFDIIVAELPSLEKLLEECNGLWVYEDRVYRFYHQSYKVYRLQFYTQEIVEKLHSLAPNRPLNEWFMTIVREGTGKEFKTGDNQNWLAVTRPILEAFFHARYFLEMLVKYGRELEAPPRTGPSGWASVLYLYDLRH